MSRPSRVVERLRAVDISGRIPPHNNDAEAAVLSALMTDGRHVDAVTAVLPTSEPFYGDANRRIYDAILELHRVGQPIDMQTVAEVIKRQDRLQAIGGVSYLVSIVDATPSVANVVAHAKIVREKWRMRRAIERSQIHTAEAYADYGDAQTFLDAAAEEMVAIARDSSDRKEASLLYDIVKSEIAGFDGVPVAGLPSGFADVDNRTSGMHPGEMIIVAGRPGMAKTSYMLNIARHIAGSTHDGVMLGAMVFSLEMPKEQIGMRLLCSEARVGLSTYRKRELSHGEHDRIIEAANELSKLPLWVDDTPSISLADLRAKVVERQRAFDRRGPDGKWTQRIGIVLIDYLQLMTQPGMPAGHREQEIGNISRGLKALAKDFAVPVVALAQLNRGVETRSAKEKRPQLSDLRDSGSIEQDADVVQFLYRPEYYIADPQSAEARKFAGYAEVITAKQRNGPTGRDALTFIGDYTRFENRAPDAWTETGDQ